MILGGRLGCRAEGVGCVRLFLVVRIVGGGIDFFCYRFGCFCVCC